jgi:hypothetical protein
MLKIIEQLAKNTNIYENKTNMSVIRLQMKLYQNVWGRITSANVHALT